MSSIDNIRIVQLWALAILGILGVAACAPSTTVADAMKTEDRAIGQGLERRVESFSRPDKYGVVCYQDANSARTLACVKVQ